MLNNIKEELNNARKNKPDRYCEKGSNDNTQGFKWNEYSEDNQPENGRLVAFIEQKRKKYYIGIFSSLNNYPVFKVSRGFSVGVKSVAAWSYIPEYKL